jgi:NADPH2:quinone reductase
MTLGMEGAGTVAALGAGAKDVQIGDRVVRTGIVRGSYAEYARSARVEIGEGARPRCRSTPPRRHAARRLTAHLSEPFRHTRLCRASALPRARRRGGVGQLLTSLRSSAARWSSRPCGTEEKAQIARSNGADHIVMYRQTDFRDEVMRITEGAGVDVVYDAVGKDTIHQSIRSLARRGLCVNYGGASGLVAAVEPLELAEAGSVFFTRPHLADYIAGADELRERARDLFSCYEAGTLKINIDREFPLAQAAAAHRYLEGRNTKGKLLLKI